MKKINLKIVLLYICFIMILLYPFNSSIMDIIYPNSSLLIISVLIPIVILFFMMCKKISKRMIGVLFVILIVILFIYINNKQIYYGDYLSVIMMFLYLLLIFILYSRKDWIKYFLNTMNIFLIGHVFITMFALFFKNIYKEKILSFVCKGVSSCVAVGNFYNGYIPGFTRHFSVNGIYMSIAAIYFFSLLIKKKSKKSIPLFLISLIALFVVGKRAHLIFSILSCVLMYLFNSNKNGAMKFIKILVISMILMFLLSVFSNYIPEINNISVRFSSLMENGEILNGRDDLYISAINLWEEKPLFGNGWGFFRYYYHFNIYNHGDVAYVDAHNVYLQLLCEVGILGFLFFVLLFIYNIYISIKNIKQMKKVSSDYHVAIIFSLGYQFFFLMYCMTGNPLYDAPTYVIYFITSAIALLINHEIKDVQK